ncbi:DNA-binding membrane protein [Lactobacillus pasteurii DSM 23907 = CRBIP 24.76]|uniref:HTH cro/C1-type domain-containing protein n=1 Tax=Lactobacillus pasteurii DSM 23907 = CRBIP 24.76 TaxID=1423790 RepID=I7LD74_9LACO|nr:DUF3955 domain-containing protein [Lactobacillus pasteurii]KRK07640.1 DNA-binding membrane protein [Lactobacillus pasteurii DSM 23907 = CRBIP 24.76]TDG77160.1 hypothetical protein C5L33_000353 [Lactobacillus pasteurii]CCI84643.1 Putative uncharacterized protein [Lactobacillus pasteurii DSM 23907 = CRBIP 24.76]
MDFGQQIKQLRQDNKLTQEEFANNLNVTRQAVSNWENNRNLPDLEMLLQISDRYNISLDKLLNKPDQLNNLTQKLIDDGKKGSKLKHYAMSWLMGVFMLIIGLFCFMIKAASVEYIDKNGILHENFFLLPIGYLFILIALIIFIVTLIRVFKK